MCVGPRAGLVLRCWATGPPTDVRGRVGGEPGHDPLPRRVPVGPAGLRVLARGQITSPVPWRVAVGRRSRSRVPVTSPSQAATRSAVDHEPMTTRAGPRRGWPGSAPGAGRRGPHDPRGPRAPGVGGSRRDCGSRRGIESSRLRRVEIGVAGRAGCAPESASRRACRPRPERGGCEAEGERRGRRRACVAADAGRGPRTGVRAVRAVCRRRITQGRAGGTIFPKLRGYGKRIRSRGDLQGSGSRRERSLLFPRPPV